MNFKAWWNSPQADYTPSNNSHREVADAAWVTAYRLGFEAGENEGAHPVDDSQIYVAMHTVDHDTFYVGTLTEIMEWCEEWHHPVTALNFYRLGDEIRVGFADLGKETRFGGKK